MDAALRRGSIFLTKDTTLGGALPKPHFLFPSSRAPRNHFASHLRCGVGGGYDSHIWVWGPLLEILSPRRAEASGWRRGSHTYLATAAGNRRGLSSRTRTPAPRFLREGRQCAAPPAGARGRLGPSTWRPRGSELPPGPRPGQDERWIPPRGTAAATVPARGPHQPQPARLRSPASGRALLSRSRRVPVPNTHGACRHCRRSGSSEAGRAAGSRETAGSSRRAAAGAALRSPRLHRPGTAGRRGRPPASPALRAPPRPPGPCRGR